MTLDKGEETNTFEFAMDWRREQRNALYQELVAAAGGALMAGKVIYDAKPKKHKRQPQIDIDFRGQNKYLRGAQKFGEGATNRIGGSEPLPFANSQTETQAQAIMSGSGEGGGNFGSGNAAGLKETPVDDPRVVYRGPPDFTFCALS